MDASQIDLNLERDSNEASFGKVVTTIHTDLGPFGNRVDVIWVRASTVGGVSHLECADPNVRYYNNQSPSLEESL